MACMSFLGCHSGLFSSARSGAAAKQPEKQEEPEKQCAAADEEQPLTEPVEAAEGAADESAPAQEAPAKAKDVAGQCLPAVSSLAGEIEESPSTAATTPAEADPEEPAPAEPEPAEGPAEESAAPTHFEGSDEEGGKAGKAAKGCCVPRASRRRNKGAKKAKHDVQEATPTADFATTDGSPKVAGQGKPSKTRASAGA